MLFKHLYEKIYPSLSAVRACYCASVWNNCKGDLFCPVFTKQQDHGPILQLVLSTMRAIGMIF